jgi:hypothetical protein
MSPDEPAKTIRPGLSRRGFLGGAAALGGLTLAAATPARAAATGAASGRASPSGSPLRVRPALTYHFWQRREKTSWRSYGGLQTGAEVNEEVKRIESELRKLSSEAEFPIEILPVALVNSNERAKEVAAGDCDAILVYAAGGFGLDWLCTLAGSKAPNVIFLRHKSGPYYLWHEIAHWRFLRLNGDTLKQPHMDADDIVVDDYGEILWRLRALYGLKNARGTKMLAIGGLQAYSQPGQTLGPGHAREVWGYDFAIVSEQEFARRLQKARASDSIQKDVERQTAALLARPDITLQTDRKFVANSFLALSVCKELMGETGATNFGFAHCMGGSVISMLDTPPCLVLSLANDEGFTAYCHTDLTHTVAGVLLRWIASRPTFVCNSHHPHHGIFTVAHCAAPRKMNGKDYEPAKIMTHFESDYGAATKVEYTRGQMVTVLVPNLRCTKWLGFRGNIIAAPSHPACRSQMDIEVDGNWRQLLTDMEGFHTQVCYGDYLREVGYALKRLGKIEWQNVSAEIG